MTGSIRCRCQNIAGCEVHAAGATTHPTGAVRDHSEIPMSTRSTRGAIQRVLKRKRKPKAGGSITRTVGIETHMEQIHQQPRQSQNSPLKPSKGVWPTEFNTAPGNKLENVDSARGRSCQSKHQEGNYAGQGHWGRAFREDFVLFDEGPRQHSTMTHVDKDYSDNDEEMIESIEGADRTEWNMEDIPHLPLPPQPRPARLPTPDFDDEIPPTFFPPLDTVGNKLQSRPAMGKCEDTMPLLLPFSNGTLDQLRFGKEKNLRSVPEKRPSRLPSAPAGSTRWFV